MRSPRGGRSNTARTGSRLGPALPAAAKPVAAGPGHKRDNGVVGQRQQPEEYEESRKKSAQKPVAAKKVDYQQQGQPQAHARQHGRALPTPGGEAFLQATEQRLRHGAGNWGGENNRNFGITSATAYKTLAFCRRKCPMASLFPATVASGSDRVPGLVRRPCWGRAAYYSQPGRGAYVCTRRSYFSTLRHSFTFTSLILSCF